MALEMMARSGRPALYIGRPCYLLESLTEECDSTLWTSARYSETVIGSLVDVIKTETVGRSVPLTLIGYSGGGALAVLIAHRLNNVEQVITVAGNLDTDAWVKKQGFVPMSASLNPMRHARLGGLEHVHMAGEEDRNIDKRWIERFSMLNAGRYIEINGFGHRCCWLEHWPTLLKAVNAPELLPEDYEGLSLQILE